MNANASESRKREATASAPGRNFSQLVSRARHDLRNPIGHILGFAEGLLEEAKALGFPHFVADLESVVEAANQMVGDINLCLDSERIEIDSNHLRRLKDQLRSRVSKIVTTTENLAHLSRALKEDVFSADLARISGSARQTVEVADIALAFVSEIAQDEVIAPQTTIEAAPARVADAVVRVDSEPGSAQKGSILVVDDLEENRELLLRRLARMQYTVHLAEHGKQAIEFVSANDVDLILLDLVMPVMDGFQTLAALKENPATRRIPVIMLSSSDETANVVHCVQLGADDFLPKPFNTTLLLARIESSIAKKRLRDLNRVEAPYYFDKGTLQSDSPSYVERQADKDLYEGLTRGEFCYVLTSRQMGKSSLMVRTAKKLREQGMNVVALDLTSVGLNLTPEQWYDGLVVQIGRQLRLEDELDDFWLDHQRLSPVQRFFTALRVVALELRTRPLAVFVDELDTVRSLPFSTDEFFAAIRQCYNRRTEDAEFGRLTFCLLGVATPADLIRDTRITPFNLGRRIELADFTLSEVSPLANGLGREPKAAEALLTQVWSWTNGHPYLTQRFCRAIAQDLSITRPQEVDRLCEKLFFSSRAREEDDNLVFVRKFLLCSGADKASLLGLYDQIRQKRKRMRTEETNLLANVLRLSGIVRVTNNVLQVRNPIYRRVFDRIWVKANTPPV